RRPPLSEVRIKDYTGDMVTFEFKDYRNYGSKVLNTVRTFEFIKRLTRHIPPHYFNVIRHYGILASRVKSIYKTITDKLLGNLPGVERTPDWRERQMAFKGRDPLVCRICQKVMKLVSIHSPNPLFWVKQRLQAAFP
ncbi:MAG: transposase, partial [Magnetococcales bacterium]|nr:transposase [Magnetococcales bacterium]